VKRLFSFVLIASVVLIMTGCGSAQGYAAQVNSMVISRSSLDGELKDIAQNKKFVQAVDQPANTTPILGTTAGTFNQGYVAQLLTERIDYAVIHSELVRRHALPNAAAVATARKEVAQRYTSSDPTVGALLASFPTRYQDTLVQRQAEVDTLRDLLTKTDLSPQAVLAYYDSHQDQFVTAICVRHILVANQAKAAQLKAQLDAGADFAGLAKANSTDQASAVNGGKLTGSNPDGCLNSQDVQGLVAQFSQAMLALPVNQVSPPVRSQFGFHLIEVTSRTVEPLDQAVVQAASQALMQPAQQAFNNLLNKLVLAASVKVNPQFGTFDKKGTQGPAVVPPKGPQVSSSGGQSPAGGLPVSPSTTVAPGG
jgi:parvulin-like peptidyl-prolyl isomerase